MQFIKLPVAKKDAILLDWMDFLLMCNDILFGIFETAS